MSSKFHMRLGRHPPQQQGAPQQPPQQQPIPMQQRGPPQGLVMDRVGGYGIGLSQQQQPQNQSQQQPSQQQQQQPQQQQPQHRVGHAHQAPHPQQSQGQPIASKQPKIEGRALHELIADLTDESKKDMAMATLSKSRDSIKGLAGMLWHAFGVIPMLLNEIVTIYASLDPPKLSVTDSTRACNALALLQCTASSPETRSLFLAAHIPLYLYPLLGTTTRTRPFEYLRLTSLGVIGALVKADELEVVAFLLKTEIIPLCLHIMEQGTELSKTVATFIVQKILQANMGLQHICQTYERFSHVALILQKMVTQLAKNPSPRLLKHVVRCYVRLLDNPKARQAFRRCLPVPLRNDRTLENCLKDDPHSLRCLHQLRENLSEDGNPTHTAGVLKPQQQQPPQQQPQFIQSQHHQSQHHQPQPSPQTMQQRFQVLP